MTTAQPSAPPTRGIALAMGFGTTVAMWAIGYVAMMRPGMVLGELLFLLTLACLFAGGFLAGRLAGVGFGVGVRIGAVSAAVNLLLIGSLVGRDSPQETMIAALIWGVGTFAVSMILAGLGAAVGSSMQHRAPGSPTMPRVRSWFHMFCCVAVAAVFMLLLAGGLVTALEAGLAVTDWPNTFGHNMLLYPLSEMTGGVYYEHTHRLMGMLVGLTTLTMMIAMFRFDRRAGLRVFTVLVFIMVCAQGIMGGLRVTGRPTLSTSPDDMQPSIALAIVHGVFGQIVFASIVAIAAFTSPTWMSRLQPQERASARTDQQLTITLMALLFVQLVLGALYRHLNAHESVADGALHLLLTHITVALLVIIVGTLAAGRAWTIYRDQSILARVGKTTLLLIVVQVCLGIGAMIVVLMRRESTDIPVTEAALTTAHQGTGALLLAAATLLMLWHRRLSKAPAR